MITLQNYKQKRASFDTGKLSQDELDVFNSVDAEFDDFLEVQNEEPAIKEMLNTHIELVNDLFKEGPVKENVIAPKILIGRNSKLYRNIKKYLDNEVFSQFQVASDYYDGDEQIKLRGNLDSRAKSLVSVDYDKFIKDFITEDEYRKSIEKEPIKQTTKAFLLSLKNFMKFAPAHQIEAMVGNNEMYDELVRLDKELGNIPKLYKQDGLGKKAIVYAHYFWGGTDHFITEEKDDTMFGQTILNGDSQMSELGYTDLNELKQHKVVELDFYWKPKTLEQALYNADSSYFPNPNEKKEAPVKKDNDTYRYNWVKEWEQLRVNINNGSYQYLALRDAGDKGRPKLYGLYFDDSPNEIIPISKVSKDLVEKVSEWLDAEWDKKKAPVKKAPVKKAPVKKAVEKVVEKVVDKKEVSHFSNEFMLIRRFYNAIKKSEVLTFRQVNLMYIAYNKAALERKVRKTSKDADLFNKCNEKVTKMFKASDETKASVEITVKDTKFLDELMEYTGDTKVNYAITLLKSFIGMQGKKPAVDKAERLLKKFENALSKDRVDCDNRLYKEFLKAKNELASYIKDSSNPIEPSQVGLSITEKKNDNLNEHEENDETYLDSTFDTGIDTGIDLDGEIIYKNYELEVAPIHNQDVILEAGEKRDAPAPIIHNNQVHDFETQAQQTVNDDDDFKVIKQSKDYFETDETPQSNSKQLPKHLLDSGLAIKMSEIKSFQSVHYKLKGDFAKFLGNVEVKPKDSVAITLDAPQGAGKTRLVFQALETFASAGYKCLYASLEEHPQSSLFTDKQDQYISQASRDNITTIGDLPNGFETLKKFIPYYDVIFIDSWSKLAEIDRTLDFDRHLRKAFDGKLFVVIFQRTTDGKMRGGSKSQFDGDIIMKIEKASDFRNSYAYFDKHRYNSTPLDQLKYNTFSQTLMTESDDVVNGIEV